MQLHLPTIALHKLHNDWWAYFPELPGLYGVGDTPSQAEEDLAQAFKLHLMAMGDFREVPEETVAS